MRMSQAFMPTLRENPADAEIPSHQLMVRAGLIRKVAPGIYNLLPFGLRAVRKVEAIVREEMDRKGGQECLMPLLLPAEPWIQTGRWGDYGDEMFRLKDRHQRQFCLAPTHEEVITQIARDDVTSYRQLPQLLYHIGNKYRDEIRPRFGVMRGREFIMKDLYSFDVDPEGLAVSYDKMYDAYARIFTRCGLEFRVVEADPGAIGGSGTHEFTVLAEHGESEIVYCDACGFAANVEKAEAVAPEASKEQELPMGKVATPGVHTIQELVGCLGVPVEKTAKILFYWAVYHDGREEMVAAMVLGHRELNEIKMKNLTGAMHVTMAPAEDVTRVTGAPPGSAGPVGLQNARVMVDREIAVTRNMVTGANDDGYHLTGVNFSRDFSGEVSDLRYVREGDICPRCRQVLRGGRGIEVGQLFKLWTKYSESLGCLFTDESGQQHPMVMGCYGIGITRTVAAVIEQCHDENGIMWPVSVAPYHATVVCVNSADEVQASLASSVYEELGRLGVEAVLDDREERAGVKFKDADLLGFPFRINVGKKAPQGVVEVVERRSGQVWEHGATEAAQYVAQRVKEALSQG
ncbi:MAG: proline--tRNA ligase [Bacillota bacterium]